MTAALPSDARATRFPVSVKGVLVHRRRVLLLKNERDEWELPGGKLEPDEVPEACLARELLEETGLSVTVGQPLRPYVYRVADVVPVLILPFVCACVDLRGLRISAEHRDLAWFELTELHTLNLPIGYRHTIRDATDPPPAAPVVRGCDATKG